ncbi:MAG: hypothetical protein LKF99_03915 [Bifidobacterium sp.]|nr:hypothetical protein [Bifidobacterium sp.]
MTTTTPLTQAWNGSRERAARQLTSGDLTIRLAGTGDIASISLGGLQISQYVPGPHDAGVSGLWLRHHTDAGIEFAPLLGVHSDSRLMPTDMTPGMAAWTGSALGVVWNVKLRLLEGGDNAGWVWTVCIRPADMNSSQSCQGAWDVISAQDLALAPTAQALSSEPYISQYIAYHAETGTSAGAVLAARQTMGCAPKLPLLVTTISEGAAAYLTDGFDFYGRAARLGQPPQALSDADWNGGRINQYEFGMACLLSTPRSIDDSGLTWHVVSTVDPDYRGDLAQACFDMGHKAQGIVDGVDAGKSYAAGDDSEHHMPVSLLAAAPALNGEELGEDEFLALAAVKGEDASGASVQAESHSDSVPLSLERDGSGRLLSYFSSHNASHVVSCAKELLVDRSHGQILLSASEIDPDTPVFAATTYMPGVFASHLVLGNTNLNRIVSVHRTSLNLLRSQGVRILVRLPHKRGADENSSRGWRLLGVPSAYIMDIGGSRWVYRVGGETITVSTTAMIESTGIDIALESTVAVEAVLSIDVEDPSAWRIDSEFGVDSGIALDNAATDTGNGIVLVPAAGTPAAQACPGLRYVFASREARLAGDDVLFNEAAATVSPNGAAIRQIGGIFTFRSGPTTSMRVLAAADMNADTGATAQHARRLVAASADRSMNRNAILDRHYRTIAGFSGQLHIDGGERLREFNLIVPWFVQNALVHFLSPHGLEQYSGAAWGTRDVCQGPFELALAFGHADIARTIILKVFAHQNTDGSLPQWFMFDQYANLYQRDSHGDIPVWPLIIVGEYLDATGDASLLDETVGFWDRQTDTPCETQASVADHLLRTLTYIRTHRVPGTDLYSYGEGDWDDTLQPARASMKKEMASTWTIALLYQAADGLDRVLRAAGRDALAKEFSTEAAIIASHFDSDFIFNDVLAGYVMFEHGKPRPVIHPSDRRTGIQYRLIPMSQAMAAGLLSDSQMRKHEQLIEDQLHYPDGVRLMNRPAAFHDGITEVFKRGEQSANVGREIGLMYTHAHIRYAETLGLLGRGMLGDELLRISPVGQGFRLATSELRQRNCYFASSDADFPDRYTAAKQWDRLKAGASDPVGVRGGWRVYSSGPGIYIRQLVQHLLGIQLHADHVVFDPVLAPEDDGTVVEISLFGVLRTVRYHVLHGSQPVSVSIDSRKISGEYAQLPYRQGGLNISREALSDAAVIDVVVGSERNGGERG